MKKNFLTKLLIVLLLTIMTATLVFSTNVRATSMDVNGKKTYVVDEFLDEESFTEAQSTQEEKIMMYDATTGETTEIDMDNLAQKIATTYTRNGGNYTRTESYDPLAFLEEPNPITPYSTYTRVTNTSTFPYRVTCRIKAEVYGNELIGSGYLVGSNLLLTNAHCVMNMDDNDQTFADWVAYPGYNNGAYNGVSSGWSKIIYSSNWKGNHSVADDWCLCILNSNIGSQVGWFGCQSYGTNAEMNGLAVKTIGYAASEGNGKYQYYSTGTLSNVQNGYFYSSAMSTGGMSGGPVTRTSDNYAVGINRGHTSTSAVGVRITQNIINLILENS